MGVMSVLSISFKTDAYYVIAATAGCAALLLREVLGGEFGSSDNGKGIPPVLLDQIREGIADTGVGIAGMRERLRDLDGALEIQSDNAGTILTITAPAGPSLEESQPLTIASS